MNGLIETPDPQTLMNVAAAATFASAGLVTCLTYGKANRRSRKENGCIAKRLGTLSGPLDWYFRLSTAAVAFGSVVSDAAPLIPFHRSVSVTSFGLALVWLAQALFVASMRTLSDQYSPCFAAARPSRLIDYGPYRYVRHPIYTANTLTVIGVAIATGSMLLLAQSLFLLAVYRSGLNAEEAEIEQSLPEYQGYRQRTGAIFPRLIRRAA